MTTPIHLPIFVRAYTELAADGEEQSSSAPSGSKGGPKRIDRPSRWSLVFDCETTIDAAQSMRVGVYQVRDADQLFEEGIFVDPDMLSQSDLGVIEGHVRRHGLKLHTARSFCEDVFLKFGYFRRGLIIGFNLPFDISRIALKSGAARRKPMRGGFSFTMSENTRLPRVRVRKIGRRQALIDFAIAEGQNTPRGMRKRAMKIQPHRGYFLDVGTLASALLSQGFTLKRLCEVLKTKTQKADADGHGGAITDKYLHYARTDVQATWECLVELRSRYERHGLRRGAHKVLSEASIGKAYLDEMGVQSLLALSPRFPRDVFAKGMCSYYGGRAEVRIRREVREVLHTDFKSMYPTVNTLMGLWPFVIARELCWRDATAETKAFLAQVEPVHFQVRANWPRLTTLVRLKPDHDLLPVRAQYDQHKTHKTNTIGLNYLTCGKSLWYTLADVIAAKILTGKMPEIVEAISFAPGEPQSDLKPIDLFGRSDFHVDPIGPSVFKRLVDLRDTAKAVEDPTHNTIKTLVNATSYGVFIEVIRDNASRPQPIVVHGPEGEFTVRKRGVEEPGNYFHPLLGTLITGAARLMLALSERRIEAEGLEWVFCDTDSMTIARPADMSRADFHRRAERVVSWFEPLNPYQKRGSILQFEKVNNDPDRGPIPLYAFAISAKRYALFNIGEAGAPIIRKASQHGLGHLIAPYENKHAPMWIPAPKFDLGIARWQHDVWQMILQAALFGDPDHVDLSNLPNFNRPAISQLGTSNWERLKWFEPYNEDRPLAERVKPFNFLISFFQNGHLPAIPNAEAEIEIARGRPKSCNQHPVAPFNRDPALAHLQAFDRETGEAVSACELKTYLNVLSRYHVSNESKFENGEGYRRGRTRRRHVVGTAVRLIGKESNRLDEEDAEPSVQHYLER